MPTHLNYSGRVVQNGRLINTPQSVTINLYTVPTGVGPGDPFWTTHNASLPFYNGVYSYDFGPIDPGVLTGKDNVYLETVIAGETLLPRTKTQSSAFSLQAGGLSHNGVSVSLNANGRVVILGNVVLNKGLTVGFASTTDAVAMGPGTMRWNSPNMEVFTGGSPSWSALKGGGGATITSVTPSAVLAGTVITINGTNFQQGSTVVYIGNLLASSNWISSTVITATVPTGFASPANLYVINTGSVSANVLSAACPASFIPVPMNANNSAFITHDFCVMQYIAGNNGGVPASSATLTPWVNISQTSAISACQSLGTGYHLITNKEWMAVARDAEQQASNWTSGIGSVMAFGWRNTGNTGVAPNNTPSCLYNTGGNNTCSPSGTTDNRRTLYLSNGNQIWDMGGNAWEWTSDLDNDVNNSSWTGGIESLNAWGDWNAVGSSQRANGGPSNSNYTRTNGIGAVYGNTGYQGYAFLRGSDWGQWDIRGGGFEIRSGVGFLLSSFLFV